MDIPTIIKGVGGFVAGIGAANIVGKAIRQITPDNLSLTNKILIGAGTFGLAGAASDIATKYVERTVDEAVESINKIKIASRDAKLNAAYQTLVENAEAGSDNTDKDADS